MSRLTRPPRSPRLHVLFALALLVRSMAVPGYMAGGVGWPVQLCPEGLAPASMILLFGLDETRDSPHHGHALANSEDPSAPAQFDSQAPVSCTLGGSAAPALPSGNPAQLHVPPVVLVNPTTVPNRTLSAHTVAFQARAPPRPLPLQ